MNTDEFGNVYVTGEFTGSLTLGADKLTGPGFFIAKWSPVTKSFAWAKSIVANSFSSIAGIAVQGANIYVTGHFSGSQITFGTLKLDNSVAGSTDMFVVKLTDAGNAANFTWAQRLGGTAARELPMSLAVSGSDIYIAGDLSASWDKQVAVFGETLLPNASSSTNVFVTKLTDNGVTGEVVWAKVTGGKEGEIASGLAVNGKNVYVAGSFQSRLAKFDDLTLSNPDMHSDVFVTKLTDNGSSASFTWAQQAGGVGYTYAEALAVQDDNVYVAGSLREFSAKFGTTILTPDPSVSNSTVFVAKLRDTGNQGNFVWALQGVGNGEDQATALAVKGPNVYVGGNFDGSQLTFGATKLTGRNQRLFVAKLTDTGSAGSFTWAQQAGESDYHFVNSLATVGNRVYVAGSTPLPSLFGSIQLLRPTGAGFKSGYVASILDNMVLASNKPNDLIDVQVYPNPAHDLITVSLPAVTRALPVTLTLLDPLGRSMRSTMVNTPSVGGKYAFDLKGIVSGVYALRVKIGSAQSVRWLTIE